MRDSRPQLLDTFFNDANLLHNVQQHAVALLKLNRAVNQLLPKQLQPHCRVANYRNGILVLETHSANWLMGLRYEQSNLLSALRTSILPSLASIDIKISPTWQDPTQPTHPIHSPHVHQVNRQLSLESASHIKTLAAQCPDKLRHKLERLAELAGESANTTSRKK